MDALHRVTAALHREQIDYNGGAVRIGILGSGLMGAKLGTILVRAGHDVVFSYSRSQAKLEQLARDSGGVARAGTPKDAVRDADVVPKARVVSAFNTVPSEVLFGVFERASVGTRPSLVYCGNDGEAKQIVAELIRDVGFEPVDAGPLSVARFTEPFALLMARLAYEGDGGPALAYRLEWFDERE